MKILRSYPLQFLLVGFVKSKVHANKTRTILQLHAEIEPVIKDIGPQMCKKVISCRRRRLEEHPLQVRHKQDWDRGFILLLPQAAVLPGSDAGSDVVKPD